jgi:hypothetical protein
MNERILKLAVEAGVTGYFAAGTEYATPVPLSNEVQKFAELIIVDILAIIADPKNYNQCVFTNVDAGQGACIATELTKKINQQFKD